MGVWEAMEKLSELVDDSDPDVSVSLFPNFARCSSRPRALPRPAFSKRLCRVGVPGVARCLYYHLPAWDLNLCGFLSLS